MRRVITTLALIAAFSLAAAGEAEAGRRNNYRGSRVSQRSNGGFFSNLMELERRKNAWLRATFLGR